MDIWLHKLLDGATEWSFSLAHAVCARPVLKQGTTTFVLRSPTELLTKALLHELQESMFRASRKKENSNSWASYHYNPDAPNEN